MVAEELRQQYTQKLLPLEENYCFHEFHSQSWRILTDFKCMRLLVGQYWR